MILGLTGGIGSGKSRVAAVLAAYGIEVIDADEVARSLLQPESALLARVMAQFPEAVVSGTLDRSRLRAVIFNDAQRRADLNALMHPAIRQVLGQRLQSASREPYCLLSAPLLLENQLDHWTDAVLVVDALPEQQIERACRRDGCDANSVLHIMQAQYSRQKRLAAAHYVIDNRGAWADTEKQVHVLHHYFSALQAESFRRSS